MFSAFRAFVAGTDVGKTDTVHAYCLHFSPGYGKLMLHPNPAFEPKVCQSSYSCPKLQLLAIHSPPITEESEKQIIPSIP